MTTAVEAVTLITLHDFFMERKRQDLIHGPVQHCPDGTGLPGDMEAADAAKEATDNAFRDGVGTWRHILEEEVREAFAESDITLLREELVQVGAVACKWVESLDKRAGVVYN